MSTSLRGLRVLILIIVLLLIGLIATGRCPENLSTFTGGVVLLIIVERYLTVAEEPSDESNPESVEGFDRTSYLKWLNKDRGQLGQFYVNCHGCGRKKILQERVAPLCRSHTCKNLNRYQTVGPLGRAPCKGCGHSKCMCGINNNRSYCIKDCYDNIGRDTVSLWNDEYIDTDEIFCYNCLLDLKSKVIEQSLAYRELPPSNGPPGYSVYRDRDYI